jgi:hypothetical protein
MGEPSFELWCSVLSWLLQHMTGRALADAPEYVTRCLREWHGRGLSARHVAERLAECRWPARATLTRFYTDDRAARVYARLVAQGVV